MSFDPVSADKYSRLSKKSEKLYQPQAALALLFSATGGGLGYCAYFFVRSLQSAVLCFAGWLSGTPHKRKKHTLW
jgi:hypothetical protein